MTILDFWASPCRTLMIFKPVIVKSTSPGFEHSQSFQGICVPRTLASCLPPIKTKSHLLQKIMKTLNKRSETLTVRENPNIEALSGFGGGCLNLVASRARAAAACCPFLMLAPWDEYSSSPSLSLTKNVFL